MKRYLVLQDERLAISELGSKGRSPISSIRASQTATLLPEQGLKSLVRSSRDEIEVKAIEEALAATNWNRKKAAARLNISYKALRNKIKQYGISRIQAA